jgi:hypothetical protein
MGLTQQREVGVLVASHGWWPWLLTLAIIVIVLGGLMAYFGKRRRAT